MGHQLDNRWISSKIHVKSTVHFKQVSYLGQQWSDTTVVQISLDATMIDLCLSLYDWAKYKRTKGAVKLHLVLDRDGYLPSFGVITDGERQ